MLFLTSKKGLISKNLPDAGNLEWIPSIEVEQWLRSAIHRLSKNPHVNLLRILVFRALAWIRGLTLTIIGRG
jgi:hypothetical protein